MRAFIVATAILLCAVIFLFCVCHYLFTQIDPMLALCRECKSGSERGALHLLFARFVRCPNTLSLFVHKELLTTAEDALRTAIAERDDPGAYAAALAVFEGTLRDIAALHRFDLHTIF